MFHNDSVSNSDIDLQQNLYQSLIILLCFILLAPQVLFIILLSVSRVIIQASILTLSIGSGPVPNRCHAERPFGDWIDGCRSAR